jgi:hypothetical protein
LNTAADQEKAAPRRRDRYHIADTHPARCMPVLKYAEGQILHEMRFSS